MGRTSRIRRFAKSRVFVLLLLLVIMTAFFTVMSKGSYIGLINIRSILNAMVVTALLTVGTVPLMISGHLDLSAGSVGTMCGVLLAVLLTTHGVPWPIAVIATLLAAGVFGLINGILVNKFAFPAFIATLAMSSIAEGMTYFVYGSTAVSIKDKTILYIGSGKIGAAVPVTIIFALAAILIYGVILARTNFGKSIYLVGSNQRAARLTGLNPKKVYYTLFINSAMLGGLAGCLLAARLKSGSVSGIGNAQFAGVTGAVLGGVAFGGGSGGMGGAFVGLLLLNGFNNGLKVLKINSYWQTVASGALLLIALLFDYLNQKRSGTFKQ